MSDDLEYTILETDRNLWCKQAKEYEKKLKWLELEVREFPELNMSNYDEQDVSKLNNWGIAVHNMLFPYPDEG